MGSMNFILSLLGWTLIPDLAAKHLLQVIYHFPFPGVIPPQPGSLQHRQHHAVAFGFVVLSYLVYSVIESSRSMPPNFYEILGVKPDVDENGLKLAFRAFAKRYHPDRVGPQGEELFMYVRDAFEALKDPLVRFAYDRFGPDAVAWRQYCRTTREFLRQGLLVSSGYHIVTGTALLFWSAIGRPSAVSFWRYILFASLLAAELSFILSPFPPVQTTAIRPAERISRFGPLSTSGSILPSFSVLQMIWPNRVPYQHILFLHQLFIFLSVGLTRVVPQFISLLTKDATDSRQLDSLERDIWGRIYGTITMADREASIILHTILHSVNPTTKTKPYHDPTLALMHPLSSQEMRETLDKLTPEMHALVFEANIKNQTSGPIATAWKEALKTSERIFPNGHSLGDAIDTPVEQESQISESLLEKAAESMSNTDDANLRSQSKAHAATLRTPSASPLPDTPSKSRSPARKGSFGPGAGEF